MVSRFNARGLAILRVIAMSFVAVMGMLLTYPAQIICTSCVAKMGG